MRVCFKGEEKLAIDMMQYFYNWLCSLLAVCIVATLALAASVNVPLDHWSYRAIDTLIGFGLMQTAVVGTKPFSRDEMARLIVEAIQGVETLPYSQRVVANRLLRRLLRTFQEEVNARTGQEVPTTFLKPLADVTAHYVHLDGTPTRLLPEFRIDGTEGTPLVRNNEGIDYEDGDNFLLTTTTYGKLWDHFAFFVQPLFTLESSSDGDVEVDVRLQKGYMKAHLGPIELELGRDAIRWGQGFRGTLVFSNHARPLDFVALSNPHPVRLPWIFRYLGLFKGSAFFSILEEDRDVSRAKLVGGRLQLKPFPWLEIGSAGGLQFDGEGVPGLDLGDFFDVIRFKSVGGGEGNTTNQVFALDLRITLPFLRYTQIYFEYGGEDSGGPMFSSDGGEGPEFIVGDNAYLVGLYIPRLTNDGRTTFRFEWMQNTFSVDSTPSVWYTHSVFTSGFTFKGRVFGHATGGDSAEYFWRLTRDLLKDQAILGLDFSYRWRGDRLLESRAFTARERHYEGGIDVQYFFTDTWEVDARFAMERVENVDLQDGNDRTNILFFIQVRYHFL
jgi:hypothetical protein